MTLLVSMVNSVCMRAKFQNDDLPVFLFLILNSRAVNFGRFLGIFCICWVSQGNNSAARDNSSNSLNIKRKISRFMD